MKYDQTCQINQGVAVQPIMPEALLDRVDLSGPPTEQSVSEFLISVRNHRLIVSSDTGNLINCNVQNRDNAFVDSLLRDRRMKFCFLDVKSLALHSRL